MTPIPSVSIVLGYLSGGVCRGLSNVSRRCCRLSFNPFTIHNILVLICVAFTTAVIFSALGMINAIIADNHDEANWVNNFVITPLTYMGGVFLPMTSLPSVIQSIAELNPILMVVSSFRYGILAWRLDSPHPSIGPPYLCHRISVSACGNVERRYRLSD